MSAATVAVSLACETGRCDRCRGTVVSLTRPVGAQCEHDCHSTDDQAIEAQLEREHFGEIGYWDE
jgi:hypothetical protein